MAEAAPSELDSMQKLEQFHRKTIGLSNTVSAMLSQSSRAMTPKIKEEIAKSSVPGGGNTAADLEWKTRMAALASRFSNLRRGSQV